MAIKDQEKNNSRAWYPVKIDKAGTDYLGIPVSRAARKYFFAKLEEFKTCPGWLVRDNQVQEWKVEGLYNIGDDPYFYGTFYKGTLLDEILNQSSPQWLNYLDKLVEAYNLVLENGKPDFKIYSLSVIFLDEGGILFLPADLISELVTVCPAEVKMEQINLLNHPDLKGIQAFYFSLGVYAYRFITGKFPFMADTENETRLRIRNQKLVPLYLSNPGITVEVSDLIMKALGPNPAEQPDLREWSSCLEAWQRKGITREISGEEKQDLEFKAGQVKNKNDRKFEITVFFNRNKWKLITIVSVAAVLILIAGTSVYNLYFKPRRTKGLTPLEIVQTYYKSVSNIDFFTLEECVVEKAGKEDLNEVMTLYVMFKQRIAYSGSAPVLSAETWKANNQPQLLADQMLFGISDLEIIQLQSGPEPVFEATYEKWYSETDTGNNLDSVTISYFGRAVSDRLYLKIDRGDWVIFQLERLDVKELEYQPD